ncbi:MAG: alpha/beta hydrolase, partial [Beijerinckiaceae bacterium]|nr:alpha/beta hydrolase [Beijerinckiaceae bacterium]
DRTFRSFAEATKSDLKALAACVRGAREVLSESQVREIDVPVLIAMGTEDHAGGDPHELSALFRRADTVDIPGRDHNQAVGDKVYKASVLEFLGCAPDPHAIS